MRGNLINVFKTVKGFDKINAEDYFIIDQSSITRRQNSFKIIDERLLTNEAKHFSSRVVNTWNSLPSNVVDSITITTFKNRLDEYLDSNPQLRYYLLV